MSALPPTPLGFALVPRQLGKHQNAVLLQALLVFRNPMHEMRSLGNGHRS